MEPCLLGGGQVLLDLVEFDLERLELCGRAAVNLRVGELCFQRRLLAAELGDPGLGFPGRFAQMGSDGRQQPIHCSP